MAASRRNLRFTGPCYAVGLLATVALWWALSDVGAPADWADEGEAGRSEVAISVLDTRGLERRFELGLPDASAQPTDDVSSEPRVFSGRVLDSSGRPCSDYRLGITPFAAIASGDAERVERQSLLVGLGRDGSFSVRLSEEDYRDQRCWCIVVDGESRPVAFRVVPIGPETVITLNTTDHDSWSLDGEIEFQGVAVASGTVEVLSVFHRRVLVTSQIRDGRCRLAGAKLLFPPAQVRGPVRVVAMTSRRVPLGRVTVSSLAALRQALKDRLLIRLSRRTLTVPHLEAGRPVAAARVFLRDQINRTNTWQTPVIEGRLELPLAEGRYEIVGMAADPNFKGLAHVPIGPASTYAITWSRTWPGQGKFAVRVTNAFGNGLARLVVVGELLAESGPTADATFLFVNSVLTDEKGWARFRQYPPGKYRFSVRTAEAMGARRVSRILELPHTPLTIELPQITCLYLDPEVAVDVAYHGAATVYSQHVGSNGWRRFDLQPGHKTFYLRGLPPGLTRFWVKVGGALGRFDHVVAAVMEPQPLRFRFVTALRSHGRLTGESVTNRLVTCSDTATTEKHPRFPWRRVRTDSEGRFSIESTSARFLHVWSKDGAHVVSTVPWEALPTIPLAGGLPERK